MKRNSQTERKLAAMSRGVVIDSLVGHRADLHPAVKKPAPVAVADTSAAAPKASTGAQPINKPPVARSNPKLVARAKQKSQTLHRAVVKKPPKKTAPPQAKLTKPQPHAPLARLERAAKTPQNPLVSRFGRSAARQSLMPQLVTLSPQQQQDTEPPVANFQPKQKHIETFHQDLERRIQHYTQKAPLQAHSRQVRPKKSWQQMFAKPLVLAPGFAAAFLIAGFIAYQQVPHLSLRVAASRSGFAATLPTAPRGFKIDGPVAASKGRVSMRFAGSNPAQTAVLHQQPSSLDSSSLRSGYLDGRGIDYQALHENGLTVYIYDGHNATWVSNGIWYSLEGDPSLTPQEILEMALSS